MTHERLIDFVAPEIIENCYPAASWTFWSRSNLKLIFIFTFFLNFHPTNNFIFRLEIFILGCFEEACSWILISVLNRLVVLVISMVLCREKDKNHHQVVVVTLLKEPKILTDLSVVYSIEENHRASNNLEVWSNSNTLGLTVLVLPSPESTRASSHQSSWWLVTASQPGTNFSNFHLSEWSVR